MSATLFWVSLADGTRVGFDVDQGLDLRHLIIDGVDMAPVPYPAPPADEMRARAIGGVMFTCGTEHIRQPCRSVGPAGGMVDWPLHGTFITNPAQDIQQGSDGDSVTVAGTIRIVQVDGGVVEVERRYSLSQNPISVRLEDRITNIGVQICVPMMMYHINFDGRFIDKTSKIAGTAWHASVPLTPGIARHCEPFAAGGAELTLALAPVRSVRFSAGAEQLPWLQIYRQLDETTNIACVEPASHPFGTRAQLQDEGLLTPLAPGKSFSYWIEMRFMPLAA
ncbi:DUF4432 family protein [Devosia rhodophyticola]|uniref:DUF4432 family protein n=1 Tax=Devosia rhodophyticola TaxID=3026423 RepID=A0ABY7YWG7_9HYPH|nr:DUF4432 family protein [Devosia rhodophyticola]WDR05190.1 DUF4432 family protein [Devosia rhodophyticola]